MLKLAAIALHEAWFATPPCNEARRFTELIIVSRFGTIAASLQSRDANVRRSLLKRCEEIQHLEFAMMKPFMAAMLLALSTTVAFADNSLPAKAMKDLPGTSGGATADPTAKPDSGSLSEKAMQDQPGVNKDKTGTTVDPTAKPSDGSLADKAMKDNPAIGK